MNPQLFKHDVREENVTVERTESWSANVCGYDVMLVQNEQRSEILLHRLGETSIYVGLVSLHPANVGELEKFASIATDLFTELAAGLRAIGKDDLRSAQQKRIEDANAALTTALREAI